jgi:hypothetical protein
MFKFKNGRIVLSEQSILDLVRNFPKLRKEVFDLIANLVDNKMREAGGRHPGGKNEHKSIAGLCGELSYSMLPLLKEAYPDIKVQTGQYILEKHPRFKDQKIFSLHSWLEADGKIIDFTAEQFAPFVNYKINEVQIMPISKSKGIYVHYYERDAYSDYKDVLLDDGPIFEYYINNL